MESMEKEQIMALYNQYLEKFGEYPPINPDCDFYDEQKIKSIKNALLSGVKIS